MNAKPQITHLHLLFAIMAAVAMPPSSRAGGPAEKPGDARTPARNDANAAEGVKTDEKPGELVIPVDRQQMIGVTYTTVERAPLKGSLRAVGTVAAQTRLQWDFVARVDGYVHDLHVSAPGDAVSKGQVLMDIYSPDLVATQNEYLDLLRMRETARKGDSPAAEEEARRLIASAGARLRQWNVSDEQIDTLEHSRQASQYLTLASPVDGVVEAVAVRQGRRVSVGDPLVSLVDLSAVWVWAEFYQEELPLVGPGVPVTITTSAYPGATLAGKIALVDPFVNDAKRTLRVRIDVENPGRRLHPQMYVDVELQLDQGVGLTVPVSAVLPTGRHNIVFVDKGEGRLEPRFISVGRRFGDRYAVTGGLAENERIVSSANFLVDAESKVQGALNSQ
ncbi:MAG TPA: efflux RND transporter periplasmic adaptor subunit [Opitutaceae bacterium]|nr:efflux RND transporter periplasmic adaptor subunit [Opitutaceae bacterium]